MAVAVQPPMVAPPDARSIVSPVLSALPGAAASTHPASTVLPLLSPILRQRVHLLASASTEPWIRLLTYDPSKVPQLTRIAQSGELDPHPVSGEIEVDWDRDIDIRYKRVDQETLQTLVVLNDFNLFFRLVFCTGDLESGGDGWRVGEVGVADSSLLTSFGGVSSLNEAEKAFQEARPTANGKLVANGGPAPSSFSNGQATQPLADDEEDDDDDYWARYDATPSRTPAAKRSPAPHSLAQSSQPSQVDVAAEDAYFAQYDSVQPAMDNHDPDEEFHHIEHAEYAAEQPPRSLPPLGLGNPQQQQASGLEAPAAATAPEPVLAATAISDAPALALAQPIPIKPGSSGRASSGYAGSDDGTGAGAGAGAATQQQQRLLRPASSASSKGSQTVAHLEEVAESRQQAEFGVKQHVARSIRSLFLLSRASGIDREEFERMVRTELDVLGLVEDDI